MQTVPPRAPLTPTAPRRAPSVAGGAVLLITLGVASSASAQTCEPPERAVVRAVRACVRAPNAEPVAAAGSIAPEVCLRDGLDALHARCPSPFVRLSLGAAEARLHHAVRAWVLLQEALASNDPLVEANRADIEQNVLPGVRRSVVLVAPTCETAEATLSVNGRLVGALPLAQPLAVEPGEVTIEVSAPGHERARRRVALAGGWEYTDAVMLVRVTAARGPETPRGQAQRAVGWVLLGTGVALGVAGAVFWGLSYDTAQRLEGYCEGDQGDAACGRARAQNHDRLQVGDFCASTHGAEGASLCARYEPQAILGWVLGAGGLALAGAGVALLVTAPRPEASSVRVSAWLRAGGGGLTLRGDF